MEQQTPTNITDSGILNSSHQVAQTDVLKNM